MKKILVKFSAVTFLLFAGCVTSPFLSEDAATRLAAVDALVEQRKLVEVALDYCTEPYQELPTGCQMDVRVRAVEKLTDRDMLMAVATFSIVRTSIRGRCCYVTLGEPNKELRELALTKLTEGRYIASVLEAKNPFDVKSLFSKALFGYYEIDGRSPVSAESAWFKTVKEKESVIVDVFCNFIKLKSRVAICQNVFSLLPTTLSQESKNLIGATFKDLVGSVKSVSDATYVLQITSFMPSEMVLSAEIDAMSKRISSHISTVEEFVSFVSLINGEAKKHISDTEELIKVAAVKLVPKLNSLGKLSVFADVIKNYEGAWVREITGNAVIAVLDSIVEGKSKETIKDFVEAVSNFDGEILSDKAILRIFTDTKIISEYESAMRSDGYKDQISNEVVGSAIRGGSLGDILAAGFVAGAMGDKKSPVYNKMFSHIIKFVRDAGIMSAICSKTYNYALIKVVFSEVLNKFDDGCLARCINQSYPKFSESHWFREIVLATGERFVKTNAEEPLEVIQPIVRKYVRNEKGEYLFRAAYSLVNPDLIASVVKSQFEIISKEEDNYNITRRPKIENKYFVMMIDRAYSIYKRQDDNKAKLFRSKLIDSVVKLDCLYDKGEYRLSIHGEEFLIALSHVDLQLMADIVCKSKLEPVSHNYRKIIRRLSGDPAILVNFFCEYKEIHIAPFYTHKDPFYWRKKSVVREGTTKKMYSWRDPKTHDWHTYIPYYGFDLKSDDPIWFYDCDWYWQGLCSVSKLKLSEQDRKKLNNLMKHVALNAMNLNVRKAVYNAINDVQIRKDIEKEWTRITSDAQNVTESYVKLYKNTEITKAKKIKLWDDLYLAKRVRMVGKFVDVSEVKVYTMNSSYVDPNRCEMLLELPEGLKATLILQRCDKDMALEFSKGDMVIFDCYPAFFDRTDNGNFKMCQPRLVTTK